MRAGFLSRLIERSMGTADLIQPLLPTRYSSVQTVPYQFMHVHEGSVVEKGPDGTGIAESRPQSTQGEMMPETVTQKEEGILKSTPLHNERTVPPYSPGEKQDFQNVQNAIGPLVRNEDGVQGVPLPEGERARDRAEPETHFVEQDSIVPDVFRSDTGEMTRTVFILKQDGKDVQIPTGAEIIQGTAMPSGMDREVHDSPIVHEPHPVALIGGGRNLEVKPRLERKESPPLIRQTSEMPILSSPVIRVTIGKIDVKAVRQEAPPIQRQQVPQAQHLTLDEYLKRWDRGG